ncbi:hypothetical protein V7794_22865 [Rhizobium laguerreae]
MKGKTRRKGKGDNMVARILDNQIAQTESALDQLAKQIRAGDVMLAELEVYECDVAVEPPAAGDAFTATYPVFTTRAFF